MDSGFFGLVLPHWGIEATVASSNKIRAHFGSQSLLRVLYQLSLELLTVELGLDPQVFLQDYSKYGEWVNDCTLAEFLARLHPFDFKLLQNTIRLAPLRKDDGWIMSSFKKIGFSFQE